MSDTGLYSPFVPRIHALAGEADARTLEWARQRGLIASEKDAAKMQALKTGHLAARTHPDASPASLVLMADWCSWFFVHDDICDDQLKHPETVEAFHRPLRGIIAGRRQASSALEGALLDLWDRTVAGAPRGWTLRFARHLNAFFDSKIWETQQRYRQAVPELDTYIAARPIASGMHVYIDLIEVCHQRWLATEVWLSLHTLRTLTARVCCWANDILSFEREKAQGEVLNLVTGLMTCGLDEHAARAQAVELHDNDVGAFGAVTEQLRRTGARWDRQTQRTLEHYIEHLGMYIRGNLDWTANATRYLTALQRGQTA